jgi:hypothetical protein
MTDGLSGFEKSSENGGRVKIRSVFCIVPFQLDKELISVGISRFVPSFPRAPQYILYGLGFAMNDPE